MDPEAVDAVGAPDWVATSLRRAPWVVVRRAGLNSGTIAVGVRGETRADRFAAFVSSDAVTERVTPERLCDRPPPRAHPAFDALAAIRPALSAAGFGWGPAGAAGYELATGRPVLTEASDLDLVLRAPASPPRATLAAIASAASQAPVRIDILIETPAGGFALEDALGAHPDILLRTPEGPRLVPRSALIGDAPC